MSSDKAVAKTDSAKSEIDPLQALAAAQALIAEKDAEIRALKERQDELSTQRAVKPGEKVFKGMGYKFEVGPAKPTDGLATKSIECCDESEAVRWYVATTEDPKAKGKQIDPSRVPIVARCVDSRRQESIIEQNRYSYLVRKYENGMAMDANEQAEFDELGSKLRPVA